MMRILDAALQYVSLGLRPIPLRGKVPLLKGWQKRESYTADDVEAWWTQWPDANVGLAVHEGCIVLDIDTTDSHAHDGAAALAALEAEHGALPPTWTGSTGGGGEHRWFTVPADLGLGNSRGRLPPGIDVRGGRKGQVAVWPSKHPDTGGVYRWRAGLEPWAGAMAPAPPWLIDILRETKPRDPVVREAKQARGERQSRYAMAALEAEVGGVMAAPNGTRNERLNRAAFSLGQLVGGGALDAGSVADALLRAAVSAGLSEQEASRTISSGLDSGQGQPRAAPEVRGSTGSSSSGTSEPPDTSHHAPILDRVSDVILARELLDDLQGEAPPVVADEGDLYRYEATEGTWAPVPDHAPWQTVAGYDGRPVFAGRGQDGEIKTRPLSLKSGQIAGIIRVAGKLAASPGFFADVPEGIAFRRHFVRVTPDGVDVSPLAPEHRCRVALPFEWDPGADSMAWRQFLDDVLAPDVHQVETAQTLQEFVGACLLGIAPRYERCLVLSGVGANGKSVFLEVVSSLFPAGATVAIAPQELQREFKRAALAGKLLNVVNEMPEADVASGELFKAIVSGNPTTAEHKNKDPFTFRPRAGHLFACNLLPGTSDASHGYWRRFLLVPLLRTFDEQEQVKGLGATLVRTQRPGVARWAVEGAARLVRQGHYTQSQTSTEALEEWREESDRVLRWTRERARPPLASERGTDPRTLYRDFREWSADGGHGVMSDTSFGKRLKLLGYKQGRDGKRRWYPLCLARDPEPATQARWDA